MKNNHRKNNFRKIFQKYDNVQIRLAEVTAINPQANTVHTSIGDFSYDYLIIAAGCKTNFFGNKLKARNIWKFFQLGINIFNICL